MQNKYKYLIIGGAGVVLILILIIIGVATSSPDISGTYELLLAGSPIGTIVVIALEGNNYIATFSNGEKVLGKYIFPRPHGNKFTIEKLVEGSNANRFELSITEDGLKGKAEIPALASNIDVFFRKMKAPSQTN